MAFLLALRLTGGVKLAAAEIGRDFQVCYKKRADDAGFAAAWDAIVAGQSAARLAARERPGAVAARGVRGAAAPLPGVDAANQRKCRDGMTLLKRRAFLRSLSESGCVEGACRAAGVSDSAVYRLRGRDADFAAAWDRALRVSGPALEQVAYERAVEGWEEPVFAGGKQVGTRWRHSPSALALLIRQREKGAAVANDPKALHARAKEAARAAGGLYLERYASSEETNAAILGALARIDARTKAEDAAACG